MDQDVKAQLHNMYRIMWYMRGSITLEQAYNLTPEDMEILNNIIKENLEWSEKAGTPIY
jgi:hypothetical protein